jgi:hypothetical protein
MLKTWPRTIQVERAAEEGSFVAYYEVEALMAEIGRRMKPSTYSSSASLSAGRGNGR